MKRFLARVMSTAGVVAVSLVLLGGCIQDAIDAKMDHDGSLAPGVFPAAEQASHIAEIGGDAERAANTFSWAKQHGSCNHSPDTEPEAFDASPECN